MAINAEVQKTDNETVVNLIRRFSKRVQGSQVLVSVRGNRYFSRPFSKTVSQKRALKSIKRRQEVATLIKLGKMPEKPLRGHRR
jgi:ribosomal protein S21